MGFTETFWKYMMKNAYFSKINILLQFGDLSLSQLFREVQQCNRVLGLLISLHGMKSRDKAFSFEVTFQILYKCSRKSYNPHQAMSFLPDSDTII